MRSLRSGCSLVLFSALLRFAHHAFRPRLIASLCAMADSLPIHEARIPAIRFARTLGSDQRPEKFVLTARALLRFASNCCRLAGSAHLSLAAALSLATRTEFLAILWTFASAQFL